jgi:ligand-binding SRPBCC domain-containing protein
MPTIYQEIAIAAPIETCFDLARNIDFHQRTLAHTKERAVAGVTSGGVIGGDVVTWEATHFGVRQRLTSRITDYERPTYFADEMVRGVFKRCRHLHRFLPNGTGTLMIDCFDYTSPLGPLGRLADVLFLERYMRGLLVGRNAMLKRVAEAISAAGTGSGKHG